MLLSHAIGQLYSPSETLKLFSFFEFFVLQLKIQTYSSFPSLSSFDHITGVIQWFLLIVLWERCSSDRLRSFADLCSVSNVSMFILSQANFGYYIHGHSPTGRSDLDLGGLIMMLAAENVGVAARRGIATDSDDHTYRMALPSSFRQAFNRLYEPLLSGTKDGMKSGKNKPGLISFATIEVYQALNRFLIRFISRVSNVPNLIGRS